MGCGSWTTTSYASYATSKRGVTCSALDGSIDLSDLSTDQVFKSRGLHEDLNIRGKIRECCDNEEHPNTVPIILALDVTGSMGDSAVKCAEKLNPIMTELLKDVRDVEFSIMAIGDTDYDNAPIQMSQFESDVRIAEHLDKVYFEGGGGPNAYESYTLAWWAGLNHARLDCWKRGKKGIIVTLGDEPINPYLPKEHLSRFLDDSEQSNRIETADLYKKVTEKYDVYHVIISDAAGYRHLGEARLRESWGKYLDDDHLMVSSVNSLPQTLTQLIKKSVAQNSETSIPLFEGTTISW